MNAQNTQNIQAQLNNLLQNFTTVQAIFTPEVSVNELLTQTKKQTIKEMQYATGRKYTFKADTSLNLKIGDYALVHANSELQIVQITEVHTCPQIDPTASYQYKWVVDKVNLEGFKHRQQEEKKAEALLHELLYVESQNNLNERFEQASKNNTAFASKWKDFIKNRDTQ